MSQVSSDSPLRDTDLLDAVFDHLIPPRDDGKLPGGGSLGLAARVAEKLFEMQGMATLVEQGLSQLRSATNDLGADDFKSLTPAQRLTLLNEISQQHPAMIPLLCLQLYAGYYQHPTVLEGLGEEPRPPFPKGYEIEATEASLMKKLRQHQPRAD